jgi:serine/threonine protein kinase
MSPSRAITTATGDDGATPRERRHPITFVLDGMDRHGIVYRSYPFAMKSIDRKRRKRNRDVDYGGLVYHSLKNEGIFARLIPRIIPRGDGEDGDDVVPGGFDPDSIEPERDLKERNRLRRNSRGSYPVYTIDGRERALKKDARILELETYYDDDSISVFPKANDPTIKKPRACQEPEFKSYYFPTCNDFHERDMGRAYDDPRLVSNPRPENEVNIAYLASGFYRDTWVLEDEPWILQSPYPLEELDEILERRYGVLDEERTSEMIAKGYRSAILKTPRMAHNISRSFLEEVWTEAIIMERLTKSPRIINIYGHCSSSTMVEVVPIEFQEVAIHGEGFEAPDVIEERNRDGVRPFNNFTSTEKLRFALDMAESLADVHGFEGGVIVHDDVQMCQWLRTPDGRLKLGDFNRATIMSWDLLRGEYCKFNNGNAFSQYRSPEEYAARNLNEKIDIFSFGNNIYAMLTGLWNWVRHLPGSLYCRT